MTFDRRRFLLSGCSALALSAVFARNHTAYGYKNQDRGVATVDLVADFGGDLGAWSTFYQAQGAFTTLTVPPGSYGAGGATDIPVNGPPGALIEGIGLPSLFVN